VYWSTSRNARDKGELNTLIYGAVMKRAALMQILILSLLFSTVSVPRLVQVACAQFEGLPYDPPIISVLSPSQNGTYSKKSVLLNVRVEIRGNIYHNAETIRWLNYSLDGQTTISMAYFVPSDLTPPYYVTANDVLHDLTDGAHNLTIYVETAISGLTGNFNTTISFEVNTSKIIVEPFPITLVAAAFIVTVAVVSVGLMIYFKKRKRWKKVICFKIIGGKLYA
jgi:ABC-type dipeptide/oligopeptide/nickel transport system permease component